MRRVIMTLVAGSALPRPIGGTDGAKRVGTVLTEQPVDYFAQQWFNE